MTNDEGLNASVKSRLSHIKQEISQLRTDLEAQKDSNSDPANVKTFHTLTMQQLDHCLTSAETVITVTIASAESKLSKPSSTLGAERISKARRMRPAPPVAHNAQHSPASFQYFDDASSLSTVPASQDSPPTTNSLADVNYGRTELMAPGNDYLNLLEPKLIQHWHDNGLKELKDGKYIEAIGYLEKVIQRSEKLFGGKFESKTLILKALAACYWAVKKWDSLHQVLSSLVPQKSEKSLDALANCHELAELYLARMNRGDLKLAEDLCKEVFQRRTHILKTQSHSLIYESIDLLARISLAKGDDLEAEAYRSLIPSGALGISYSDRINVQKTTKSNFCASQDRNLSPYSSATDCLRVLSRKRQLNTHRNGLRFNITFERGASPAQDKVTHCCMHVLSMTTHHYLRYCSRRAAQ